MQTNISKFQSIILRPKGSISDVTFCISESILTPVYCVKLLGVKIDDRLSFDDLISSICLRVSYQINGLRRITKYMTIENRISIYNAFLSANFTYCNTVWHFCSNRSLYMLEKVNKKTLRVVLNDYVSTYRDLLDKVSKPTLYVARLKAIAIEAYKCYVNENPQYINAMFDSVDRALQLERGPLVEQLTLRLLDWILLHIQLRRYGILYPPIIKRHLLFPILSNIYWNGQDLTANVDAVFYVVHMMFDLYVLKIFCLFYKCFYQLLINCHGFLSYIQCVF